MTEEIPGPPYHVTVEQKEPKRPGVWGTTIIAIHENERRVGSYERLYPSYGESTFAPFEQNGQWYALMLDDEARAGGKGDGGA